MNLPPFAAAVLLLATGTVQAASLTLVPSAASVAPNGSFTVNLFLDATDALPDSTGGLYGGGIVLDFNPALLTYGGFTLASGLSFYENPVVATSGGAQTVTFGFDNAAENGLVGTFSFTAIGPVGSLATLGLADADDFSGSFASYVPKYQRFFPSFGEAEVSIVPLPAGVWLLGTAVGALVVRQRRRVRD